jgi:hypothetical protein
MSRSPMIFKSAAPRERRFQCEKVQQNFQLAKTHSVLLSGFFAGRTSAGRGRTARRRRFPTSVPANA